MNTRNCKKGIPCGSACISSNKVCRKTEGIPGSSERNPLRKPKDIRDNLDVNKIINKARLEDTRALLVEKYGEDMVSQAEQDMRNFFQDAVINIALEPQNLDKVILESGRFKATNETNARGNNYQEHRDKHEEALFPGSTQRPKEESAIYGFLSSNDPETLAHERVKESYGDIVVTLKSDAMDRATMVLGDSFRGTPASPVSNPNGGSLEQYLEDRASGMNFNSIDDLSVRVGYVEAQIHGQVRATDIQRISFSEGNMPSPELQAWAETNQVEIFYVNDGTYPWQERKREPWEDLFQ